MCLAPLKLGIGNDINKHCIQIHNSCLDIGSCSKSIRTGMQTGSSNQVVSYISTSCAIDSINKQIELTYREGKTANIQPLRFIPIRPHIDGGISRQVIGSDIQSNGSKSKMHIA